MKQYLKFDTEADVNMAVCKAWDETDTLKEWIKQIAHIYNVQQFYYWEAFMSIVEELTGYITLSYRLNGEKR